jgi:ribosomal-protein-alanine N-acetyltransferase
MLPILTARLSLRRFQPEDAEKLVALFADNRVAKWVGDGTALPLDEAKRWIENSHKSEQQNGSSAGAVIERASNELIGWAGIVHPPQSEPELIYGFRHSAWGQGYGYEIAKAIVDAALHIPTIKSLIATVDPENTASIRILKRINFALVDSGLDEDGLPTDTYRCASFNTQ